MSDSIVIVPPGGFQRAERLVAAIRDLLGGDFMGGDFIGRGSSGRFQASGDVVTEHGATAVVECDLAISWRNGGERYGAAGREIPALNGSTAGRLANAASELARGPVSRETD